VFVTGHSSVKRRRPCDNNSAILCLQVSHDKVARVRQSLCAKHKRCVRRLTKEGRGPRERERDSKEKD
jgi:hypothetical protein